ncbi:MAG: glycoside hydrolase family 9 protein [Bacteroidetes bacterium]|nr:glycoside hydrolase family 9 protein [Bacteroidota bacterium]MBS1539675.1 glycoside hydrolase family 9 protein [Bacteroidota bacterium]
MNPTAPHPYSQLKKNLKKYIFIIPAVCLGVGIFFSFKNKDSSPYAGEEVRQWIRINQLGYTPDGIKVAVWAAKEKISVSSFELVDSATGKIVFKNSSGQAFGSYGPFENSYRLNFTSFHRTGIYFLRAGKAVSPFFKIDKNVYQGAADFCLFYMRQQRSGFNPFLKDSCHTHDGYTRYGPMPDSTHIDVAGGWHDATDYLQYSTTSANATWHLLAAYRDFPDVFTDKKLANGLDGKNGMADVLDEAKWGLDWLLKMHPKSDWMFNQLADDRDHAGMRLPKQDPFYGKGFERPVYFINGLPQQRAKLMNNTTGTSSTAAKFAGAFSLGSVLFSQSDAAYAKNLLQHAGSAMKFALKKPGVTQTVSVLAPYIYAEDNWTDDMELGFASLAQREAGHKNNTQRTLLDSALKYSRTEKITPWLYTNTANHYQYYPFINLGHYELAKQLKGAERDSLISYYKQGIKYVWQRASQNAFYRGVPYIWCSNNLTTSFAIQCMWYRMLSGDTEFHELEQANVDWLFGCNPWGTSMVYGLPSWGDTPVDPHSSFTQIGKYPIYGGLVDGPIYTKTYKTQLGITLNHEDSYAPFQSDLAVYHDDFGDYSTNEPTMDGTASLIYLLAAKEGESRSTKTFSYGGIVRGDSTRKEIALVFTGDGFADGGMSIANTLHQKNMKASFFLTGNFYRNPTFKDIIQTLIKDGNYLGSHSDKHLLYCDWSNRDSLLVTKKELMDDLNHAYEEMGKWGIPKDKAPYFLPPYEWYNRAVAGWVKEAGLQLVNYTSGTRSNADYTFPSMGNKYVSSKDIFQSILDFEKKSPSGLNGFILLIHIGTDPQRTDKFYTHLPKLINRLQKKGYRFVTIPSLLN